MGWKYSQFELDSPTSSTGIDLSTMRGIGRPNPALCATGGAPALLAADGVDSTPVATEIYVAELFVPFTVLATGIAVMNGSVSSDTVKVALFDANGVLLRAGASTAASGTDTYQKHAFATGPTGAAATTLVVPTGTYYVALMINGTTNRFNTWGVGVFNAGKITGATYSTAFVSTSMTITPPTTFTTALGPIASLY